MSESGFKNPLMVGNMWLDQFKDILRNGASYHRFNAVPAEQSVGFNDGLCRQVRNLQEGIWDIDIAHGFFQVRTKL